LLGRRRRARLGDDVPFAVVTQTTRSFEFDLSAYPPWLVVAVGTIAAALVVWIVMKLLKWTLWLVFFGVLIGGLAWAAWLFLQ
jgi:hypothetical protein